MTSLLLPGPAGDIELETLTPEVSKNITTIICHPHPLLGGTMNNKVVTTLVKAFGNLGCSTVRFNFRGVGKTAGTYDKGIGETEDVIAIAHWVQTQRPDDILWLAGFSFGTYVATRAASQLPVKQLVTVAPAVTRFDFMNCAPVLCPWLIIQGEEDEVVTPEAVFSWANTLQPPPTVIRFPNTGHFFHGKLIELREAIEKAFGTPA